MHGVGDAASVRCRDVAPVWLEQGALALPSPETPLVCVGPGTGVAPFRSFLWERLAATKAGTAVGPSVLVFGCRNKAKDFLYAEVRRSHPLTSPAQPFRSECI